MVKIVLKNTVLLLCLFLLSFYLRFTLTSHPFWVDEFSTARQASLWLEHGTEIYQQAKYVEHHNLFSHWLVAGSFFLFGRDEATARMPFIFIGSFIPVIVFIITKKMFSTRIALLAALFIVFSYIDITWSRQARGYVIQQVFLLALLGIVWWGSRNTHLSNVAKAFFLGMLVSILGVINHSSFIFYVAGIVCWLGVFSGPMTVRTLRKYWILFSILSVCGLLVLGALGLFEQLNQAVASQLFHSVNNYKYYHAYLWREFTLVTILSMLGVFAGWSVYKKPISLLLASAVFPVLFFFFFFNAVDTRYLFPFFPLYGFILIAVFFEWMSGKLFRSEVVRAVFCLGMLLFILVNGQHFTLKKKSYYSLNHTMREIAVIDYDQLYDKIMSLQAKSSGEFAVIETWPDRLLWYLPEIRQSGFLFRWRNSGVMRSTNLFNVPGESFEREVSSGLQYVGDFADLKDVMTLYPQGVIWIDDTSLPRDVVDYVEQNLKKELYLDHYPLDDNPYSIWPGTLYSWGIE